MKSYLKKETCDVAAPFMFTRDATEKRAQDVAEFVKARQTIDSLVQKYGKEAILAWEGHYVEAIYPTPPPG